jgi:hypothetical protein
MFNAIGMVGNPEFLRVFDTGITIVKQDKVFVHGKECKS